MLTAQPEKSNAEYYDAKATQWFVVSDIGLTTYTGQDGLNVFARSLGSAKPIANAELTLLAKNNEILGTAKTDAEGRATFNPGLTRGEGSMVPAVLMANAAGGGDFVFLDMSKAGFDLSDRGVEGRASPGALDVFAWTERGIYRVGETVHVGALARDDSAKAVEKLPLTFVFSRPDGVEERRVVADGASAGGYAVELPISPNAMRGAWSVAIYTDPKEGSGRLQILPGRRLRAGSHRDQSEGREDRDRAATRRPMSMSTASSSTARRPPAWRLKARSSSRPRRPGTASRTMRSALPMKSRATARRSRSKTCRLSARTAPRRCRSKSTPCPRQRV